MTEYRTKGETLVKIWVPDIAQVEAQSLRQLDSMGNLPFIFDHIAVMPDVHLGKGAVVGSVVPARDAVVPNIVGVDIGCGISAFQTGISREVVQEASPDGSPRGFWKRWENQVSRDVPTGFHQHKSPREWHGLNTTLRAAPLRHFMDDKVPLQLGTLGGGNHFIEAQYDESDGVWFMVHSGSRHTGLQIAEHYDRIAATTLGKSKTDYPANLAYLRADGDGFDDYLHDMEWAVSFALENRWLMLERAVSQFVEMVGGAGKPDVRAKGINIHHNFARVEEHGGRRVVVHRKGATSARKGEVGIVPGSMGTESYIVRGKGSAESFESCSHGAGRVMSRTRARKTIAQKDYERALSDTFTKPSGSYIDEAPQSYKDVSEVIRHQTDLVDVLHRLKPIITIKGDSKASID
ncbi:RtcB family protein [Candidatus Poribacteria bacterium]|nr:RtcB family protein [Candidatus Poribacteria bacterium]